MGKLLGGDEKLLETLDKGYVNLVESWGSDERVIESARMSTNKSFQGWDKDEKLLRYLWTHKHFTPFEMAGATFEIQAPIFVAREWMRHRTQSYNELSGRYSELPDLFYYPTRDRLKAGKQSKTNKQGSEEGFTEVEAAMFLMDIVENTEASRKAYEKLLEAGVARELARLVVPVNQYTRFRASANLRNWLAFLELRLGEGVQWEMKEYATGLASILEERFPRTYTLFKEDHERV